MAQREWIGIGEKMPPLHQHVGGNGYLHTGRGRQQCAVVADAKGNMISIAARRASEIAGD